MAADMVRKPIASRSFFTVRSPSMRLGRSLPEQQPAGTLRSLTTSGGLSARG
jgi:hypothetical protein